MTDQPEVLWQASDSLITDILLVSDRDSADSVRSSDDGLRSRLGLRHRPRLQNQVSTPVGSQLGKAGWVSAEVVEELDPYQVISIWYRS